MRKSLSYASMSDLVATISVSRYEMKYTRTLRISTAFCTHFFQRLFFIVHWYGSFSNEVGCVPKIRPIQFPFDDQVVNKRFTFDDMVHSSYFVAVLCNLD